MIRDELFVLVAEDEHLVFQGDEVQVLVKHLRRVNKSVSFSSASEPSEGGADRRQTVSWGGVAKSSHKHTGSFILIRAFASTE